MTTAKHRWRIRLSAAAQSDFKKILAWSVNEFGEAQARRYADTLSSALEALMEGPDIAGSRKREDIAKGLMSLHVARKNRNARHILLYRIGEGAEPCMIDVLRILHDSMDLARHAPTEPMTMRHTNTKSVAAD